MVSPFCNGGGRSSGGRSATRGGNAAHRSVRVVVHVGIGVVSCLRARDWRDEGTGYRGAMQEQLDFALRLQRLTDAVADLPRRIERRGHGFDAGASHLES